MPFVRYQNSPEDTCRARELRKQASMPERLLWNALCEQRKETGFKFRRQQPLHPYIADFALLNARLVVELDGISHDSRQAYDAVRDACLRGKGWTILRFTNEDIKNNLEGVVSVITAKAKELVSIEPSPNPSRKGRGTKSFMLESFVE